VRVVRHADKSRAVAPRRVASRRGRTIVSRRGGKLGSSGAPAVTSAASAVGVAAAAATATALADGRG